ncbi:MAG: SIR2 family protein [Bacteroidota bacterium]
MKQVSLLLGAGFSIPKGYPSGGQLNEIIANFNPDEYTIGTAYELIKLEEGQEDIFWYSSHNTYKFFLSEMIAFFNSHFEFDYEEFYDFLQDPEGYNKDLKDNFNRFFKEFSDKYKRDDLGNLIMNTTTIYNKLIPTYIKDGNGNRYYEPTHVCKPIYPIYGDFLYLLEKLGQDYDIVHIHTLNHDVLFETFSSTDWLNGEMDDGFQELGSPYYGVVEGFKRITHKVRLPFYSGYYSSKFRLYKLHGSIDYFPIHEESGRVEVFVKSAPGVDYMDFSKEIKEDEQLKYRRDWLNLHPDFLSGTNSKILRYKEPAYYTKVFEHFENNLKNSESLIIIGYGFKDEEVNRILKDCTEKIDHPPVIFEPFPSKNHEEGRISISGKIVEKGVENIKISDIYDEPTKEEE